MEYDNIISLAKENSYKKIIIRKGSWSRPENWCRVDRIIINPDEKYGFAFGYINYADGNIKQGKIDGAGTYNWKVIKVLDEDMKVEQRKK